MKLIDEHLEWEELLDQEDFIILSFPFMFFYSL